MKRSEMILEAIRCCRKQEGCEMCPLQGEICDELYVEMEEVPAELLDEIEKVIGNWSILQRR